ncbi:clasp N terminal domain-containing protein [Trichoderma velutinum]
MASTILCNRKVLTKAQTVQQQIRSATESMADTKLTDDQVSNLATVLRNDNTHLDVKVQYVNTIKTGIKQHNVPETCIPQLFEGLRSASSSQHVALATAGFTALNHLFTRMSRQEPKYLAKESARTLPLVIEKLGDSKDKPRALAMQSLNTLYAVAPADVERSIRNIAMGSKNPRAKEASMQWLLETHQQHGLPFRGYVPNLMELLEDADGMVRDMAKNTVIELFKNAPGAAKSDLKRQLKNFKVRPAIEQAIVKALAPTGPRSETPSDAAPALSRPALSAPASFAASERPVTPMEIPAEAVEPQYVNTHRELDDIIKEMAQKKASLATKNLPSRPGSAMSTFTTPSAHSSSTQLHTTASKPLARHRTETNTISVNASGMSVAPMRPARRRPEVARPATAGPYSVRDQPSSMEAHSPENEQSKYTSSSSSRPGGATTPKRPSSRAHISHASESGMISPTNIRPTGIPSPRGSPARLRHSQTMIHSLSPTRATDDLTLVVPTLSSIQSASPRLESMGASPPPILPTETSTSPRNEPSSRALKVYEDPFTEDQPTPAASLLTGPVLEERPINEDAANIQRPTQPPISDDSESQDKNGQNARLLDSGITKIKAKTLEVYSSTWKILYQTSRQTSLRTSRPRS